MVLQPERENPPMPRRMSQDREQMLLREYRAWDPSRELFVDFCRRVGVSRQAMYTVLERNNEPRRHADSTYQQTPGEAPEVSAGYELIDRLIAELSRKERRIVELEEELLRLRGE